MKKLHLPAQIHQFFWICWLMYFCTYLGRLNFTAVMAELITAQGITNAPVSYTHLDVYKRQDKIRNQQI